MTGEISSPLREEWQILRELSDRLVEIQRPIQILDNLKWDDTIRDEFFKYNGKRLPNVTEDYYKTRPMSFNPEEKIQEFSQLELDVQKKLGRLSSVGKIIQRMCAEYRWVIQMLQARGTETFSLVSQRLYGSADDVFYAGGPTIRDLSEVIATTLPKLKEKTLSELDDKKYTSEDVVNILGEKLASYFGDHDKAIRVEVSDTMVADAAAGAESIRIRSNARFSMRDMRVLEVHEGWVHLGTTLNGLNQPVCTFLSKGPPSSTITQEGLAVIMEVFTFTTFPARLERLVNRIRAIEMAEKGADFLEVYEYFLSFGATMQEAYTLAVRVFRGTLPEGGLGPFTKDLSYCKGFVMIYNFLQLAIREGALDYIPLLFLGKTNLEDLPVFAELVESGAVQPPKFIPPQFNDLAALSSWLGFSLFLNKLDIAKMAADYRAIIRPS